VDVLMRYWRIFDEIHTRQAGGMLPLWGLVEEARSFDFYERNPNQPYQPQLYLRLLPKTLLTEIERLWGTMMLPRWPDHIISEPFPHMALAETIGPALKLWHGCALTAWFLCEGPTSRTDMAGLAQYYQREIKSLEELGTPIDAGLFEELVKAEARLGPPQPSMQNTSTMKGKQGISLTVTTNFGSRREGFEQLRDIITRYRRSWAEKHLNQYIRLRWETEIREAGRIYNLLLHERGKAPTPRQFANEAATAINHWFGGDLSGLYGALREKSPIQPIHVTILPTDRVAFAFSVFQALGGNPLFRQEHAYRPGQDYQAWRQESDRHAHLSELAGLSFWYIQLEEGLEHAPDRKEFGLSKFTRLSQVISEDTDKAWQMYAEAIEAAKQNKIPSFQLEQSPGPGNMTVSPSEHVLLTSQQLPSSLPSKDPPPKQKRSWLDRLLRRG
jgi:hypothetical protein